MWAGRLYMAEWKGKCRVLIPDENTKELVRFIYEKFIEKESYSAVAHELNRRRMNPPGVYQKTREAYFTGKEAEYKGWDKGAVERIVKSETYVGSLVQGKTSITARDEKNRVDKPKGEWIVIKQAHEPLIDKKLYDKAGEVRQKIQKRTAAHKHPAKDCPIEENIFHRVLYCGVCGRKMTRSSRVRQCAKGEKVRQEGYFCPGSGQTKAASCPESNRISKKELGDIILSLIRMELAVFLNSQKSCGKYGKYTLEGSIRRSKASLKVIEGRIRRLCEEEGCAYGDYRAGQISPKEYAAFKTGREEWLADFRKQKEEYEREIKALEKMSEEYPGKMKALIEMKNAKELTKDMIEAFIAEIYVYPGKRIEVKFAFTASRRDEAE